MLADHRDGTFPWVFASLWRSGRGRLTGLFRLARRLSAPALALCFDGAAKVSDKAASRYLQTQTVQVTYWIIKGLCTLPCRTNASFKLVEYGLASTRRCAFEVEISQRALIAGECFRVDQNDFVTRRRRLSSLVEFCCSSSFIITTTTSGASGVGALVRSLSTFGVKLK